MPPQRRNIYFASDFHLGTPNAETSRVREKKIVRWLNQIAADAKEVYLMGDLFDFWFEYRQAVPKGYTRLLGAIAALVDSGIPVTIFVGNHDLWMRNYITDETGAEIIHKPVFKEFDGATFYLAHGDGLGPGDQGFKFIRRIFTDPTCQRLFRFVHPDAGIGMANYFSRASRKKTGQKENVFLGEDKEWLILHSRALLQERHIDYFIYGHRHLPLVLPLNEKSFYINLGDWITHFTYAVWDGGKLELRKFGE